MGEEEILWDAGSRDEEICSDRRDQSCCGERGDRSFGVAMEDGRGLRLAGGGWI
jgi:hypothetical protein